MYQCQCMHTCLKANIYVIERVSMRNRYLGLVFVASVPRGSPSLRQYPEPPTSAMLESTRPTTTSTFATEKKSTLTRMCLVRAAKVSGAPELPRLLTPPVPRADGGRDPVEGHTRYACGAGGVAAWLGRHTCVANHLRNGSECVHKKIKWNYGIPSKEFFLNDNNSTHFFHPSSFPLHHTSPSFSFGHLSFPPLRLFLLLSPLSLLPSFTPLPPPPLIHLPSLSSSFSFCHLSLSPSLSLLFLLSPLFSFLPSFTPFPCLPSFTPLPTLHPRPYLSVLVS